MTPSNTPGGEELKPCPFCGSKPYFNQLPHDEGDWVQNDQWVLGCAKCGICIAPDCKENQIEQWNTRPPKQEKAQGQELKPKKAACNCFFKNNCNVGDGRQQHFDVSAYCQWAKAGNPPTEQGKAQGEMKIFSDCIPGGRSMKKSEQVQAQGNLKPLKEVGNVNAVLVYLKNAGVVNSETVKGALAFAGYFPLPPGVEAQPRAGEWINVKERLPAIQSHVNAWVPENQCTFTMYVDSDGHWHLINSDDDFEPTHWMPLPNPPAQPIKEERNKNGIHSI